MKNISLVFAFLSFSILSIAQGYQIGDVAADFSLKNIDNKMVSLSDYEEANGFIIIFTCNHCPFAVKYEDRIIALHNEMAQLGWPVIAINPNNPETVPADDFSSMKQRATQKGFTFPYLMDEAQKIYPLFGATKTPHVFLLDADRVVKYIGAIDDNYAKPEEVTIDYIRAAIEAITNGGDPEPNFTKAIGCSIKS